MNHKTLERPPQVEGLITGRIDEEGIESRNSSLSRLYDIEFFQMEAGELRVEIDYIATATSVLYLESYNSSTHALGSLRAGFFGFALPVANSGSVWWGHEQDNALTGTAIGGETIDIFFKPGHRHYIAVLPHVRLLRAVERTELGRDAMRAVSLGRDGNLMHFDPVVQNHIAERFRVLLAAGAAGRLRGAGRFDELLLGAALSLLDTAPPRLTGARSCNALFRRAIDLHDSMPEAPTVTSLCLALRASPRTLEAAFKTCSGMGPHRFFLRRRLNKAKELLSRRPQEAASVTDVALELGFTELGRFSVRYRELFGESPSATLRRAG